MASLSNLLDALHGCEVEFAHNYATTHDPVSEVIWAALLEAQPWLARYCRSVTGEDSGTLKIFDFYQAVLVTELFGG